VPLRSRLPLEEHRPDVARFRNRREHRLVQRLIRLECVRENFVRQPWRHETD